MEQNVELGLTGQGVAPVRIEALDKLVEKYVNDRDKRMALTKKESESKSALVDAMHEHEEQLRQPDGSLRYVSGETTVSLVWGDEKLKVEVMINDD